MNMDFRQLAQALVITVVAGVFGLIVIASKGIAPIAIAAFGCLMIMYGALRLVRGRESQRWPVTSGKVVESDVGVQYRRLAQVGPAWYFPAVKYSYSVNGKSYIGTRYASEPQCVWNTDRAVAREIVADLHPGRAVSVYYNPNKPDMALLYPGLGARTRSHYLAIVVSGVLILAFGLFLSWIGV